MPTIAELAERLGTAALPARYIRRPRYRCHNCGARGYVIVIPGTRVQYCQRCYHDFAMLTPSKEEPRATDERPT